MKCNGLMVSAGFPIPTSKPLGCSEVDWAFHPSKWVPGTLGNLVVTGNFLLIVALQSWHSWTQSMKWVNKVFLKKKIIKSSDL